MQQEETHKRQLNQTVWLSRIKKESGRRIIENSNWEVQTFNALQCSYCIVQVGLSSSVLGFWH